MYIIFPFFLPNLNFTYKNLKIHNKTIRDIILMDETWLTSNGIPTNTPVFQTASEDGSSIVFFFVCVLIFFYLNKIKQ